MIYRILFAAALFLPAVSHAETFDEMWNRRIAEPLAEANQLPVRVKTVEIKPTPAPKPVEVERPRRHRHRR